MNTIMNIQLQPEFEELLQPLGADSAEFFLATSLYQAGKISFASAAYMAGLDFESFKARLVEHFNKGYLLADETVLEDIETVYKI